MDLTRRSLIKSGLVAGGAGVLSATTGSLSAHAVSGVSGGPTGRTTLSSTYRRGTPGAGGYLPVVRATGEPHLVRDDLGVPALPGRASRRTAVSAFAQITDVHIIDVQSPARVEWCDRYDNQYEEGDPAAGLFGSAYRPHEMLTAQIAESMVRAISRIGSGPVTGKPLEFTLQTGDNSDNSQLNEIRWNIDILDGAREVRPDSGDLTRFEGVADNDPVYYDNHYWHPDAPPLGRTPDLAKRLFGFPTVPGLLDAARRPFTAKGLRMPWITAFGNHDTLVQGNFPASTMQLNAMATGDLKIISPPTGMSQNDVRLAMSDPALLSELLVVSPYVRQVTPDPDRRLLTRAEVVEEHFRTTGTPVGHGFTDRNRQDGTAYYAFDQGGVRFIVLDSVNPNGYAEGSLDATQFAWLQQQLAASADRLVVVASHHTSGSMSNPLVGTGGDAEPRVLGDEVVALLLQHPQVVAWVNGHSHTNQIWPRRRADGAGGFWEINTASHVEWPQQSRLIEVVDNADGTLSIFTTMVDHTGTASYGGRTDSPQQLAALARELAANDWHERSTDRRGDVRARNVELLVADPR
jgi:metallophosphoesterase (TIGR03767 family)